MLESSHNTLSETKSAYDEYGAELHSSKGLLRKLSTREMTDRILAILGGIFFILTVLYISKKRLGNVFDLFRFFWSSSDSQESSSSHDEL